MARAGIYKSDVLRARNVLVAQGRHPSIDAIRVELGNTGSKGTIHRHLKEIEEEEFPPSSKVKASDAIQDLVSRLATRLEQEAGERLAAAEARHAERVAELERMIQQGQQEVATVRAQLGLSETALAREQTLRRDAAEQLSRVALELAQHTTQIAGLQERLAEAQAHTTSLEEKHQHAREALEHFRTAAKEQREREQRQHEQQVQYLQSELAKANEALAGKQHDLRAALQEKVDTISQLQAARMEGRQLEERLRDLKPLQEQLAAQIRLVEQLRAQATQHMERIAEVRARSQELERRNTALERESAAAQAATEAKDQLVAGVMARLSEVGKMSTAASGT